MTLEIGNYIQDLVQSNPAGGDDFKQGDDHLRLMKGVLKTTFPNATKSFRFPTAALAAVSTVTVIFPDHQNKLFPVNAAGGAISVNLPDPTSGGTVDEDGFAIAVVKTDTSVNVVTITPSGAHTIGGAANLQLTQQFDYAMLIWDKLDARWYAQAPSRDASEAIKGIVERATDNEASAGSDTTRYITSAQLHEARVQVASAATVDLGAIASNFVRITGTQVITSFGTAAAGVWRDITFGGPGSATLTHHATNLMLPGNANIATAVEDRCYARSLGSGQWIVMYYAKASGLPVVSNTVLQHALTAIIEDQKAQNTVGDSFAGTTNTRTLNTLVYNRSSIASLSSNRFTLPAGTWFIKWWAPVGGSINGFLHQSYLYNQSDSAEVKRGTSGHIDTGTQTDAINHVSVGSTVVTIAGSKAFEIRHDTNQVAGNMGPAANLGTEVYTRVEVWSLA